MTLSTSVTANYDVTFGDHVLRFGIGSTPQLVDFMRAYFEPSFTFGQAAHGPAVGWTVTALIGDCPVPFAEGAATAVDVDRSGGFLRCTGLWVPVAHGRLVRLLPFGVTVLIEPYRHTITLWGPDEAALRVPCLRVVEDVTTHGLERDGWVHVHASAVVAGGQAVLLCGNKGAGKTSGLCMLLRGFAVTQMANDNCVLRVVDGQLVARGWPGFFKVEVATITRYAELGAHFPASSMHLLGDPAALSDVYDKVALYPQQGAEGFGVGVVASAPVGCVVFPRFDAARAPRLAPLPVEDLTELFPQFVQGSRHPNHPDWMDLGAPTARQRDADVAAVVEALRDVERFTLSWAPSYEDLLAEVAPLRPFHRGVRASSRSAATDDTWPPLPRSAPS